MTQRNVLKSRNSRVQQGDVYRNVEFIEYATEINGNIEISKIIFPFVIVLTQDCDLSQDYKVRWSRKPPNDQDKKILSVLVAPLYNEEHFFEGSHLSKLDMKMQTFSRNRSPGKSVLSNKNPRYHYLKFPDNIPIVNSVIDFKQYFSVNVSYLKSVMRKNYICRMGILYREDICQRFAAFLSRIGLPD